MKTATAIAADNISFLVCGGAVKRYHTVITTRDQTIAEHSFNVAWFAYWLESGEPSASLLMAALAHDMAEQHIGDIPAPAKKSMVAYAEMKNLETDFLRSHAANFQLNEQEKLILSAADRMEGLLFCICQREMGNINITIAGNNFLRYLKELELQISRDNLPFRTLLTHLERLWISAQSK